MTLVVCVRLCLSHQYLSLQLHSMFIELDNRGDVSALYMICTQICNERKGWQRNKMNYIINIWTSIEWQEEEFKKDITYEHKTTKKERKDSEITQYEITQCDRYRENVIQHATLSWAQLCCVVKSHLPLRFNSHFSGEPGLASVY